MSAGPLGQHAITVQESQLGDRRFAGTFKAGMCFEYFTLLVFLAMAVLSWINFFLADAPRQVHKALERFLA